MTGLVVARAREAESPNAAGDSAAKALECVTRHAAVQTPPLPSVIRRAAAKTLVRRGLTAGQDSNARSHSGSGLHAVENVDVRSGRRMRLEEKKFEGVRKGPKYCARFRLTTLRSVVIGKSNRMPFRQG